MLTLFSPAKANLFFKVLFKRKDGYHEIASLFQTLNFGDTLTLSLFQNNTKISTKEKTNQNINNHDQFTSEGIQLPIDFSENLIGKALFLFRNKMKDKMKNKSQANFFVKIHLQKRIPLQSGLGGGSSNAATTLYGLNSLLENPLTQKELLELAEQLGSDVPFFFSSGSAYCEGRGEKFKDVNIGEDYKSPFYLAFPDFGLSTPAVFRAFELETENKSEFEKQTKEISANEAEQALLSWKENEEINLKTKENEKTKTTIKNKIKKTLETEIIFNDLEEAAFKIQPKLKTFKKHLLELGFSKVSMTGSGSAFLCFGEPKDKAQLQDKRLKISDSDISFRLVEIEMLQRNSASWYPVCVWKKNSLLLPVQPVLSARL